MGPTVFSVTATGRRETYLPVSHAGLFHASCHALPFLRSVHSIHLPLIKFPDGKLNRKYVQELEERGLIVTERTSIITQDGRKQNGSLLYTILPIQFSIGEFYQWQMDAVDRAKERQRVARRMEQSSV